MKKWIARTIRAVAIGIILFAVIAMGAYQEESIWGLLVVPLGLIGGAVIFVGIIWTFNNC